jgi:hypothetical protein
MRARSRSGRVGKGPLYLVGIMAGATAVLSGLWIGCGSSTTENNPADSGVDAPQDTSSPPQDTGVDAGVDAPTDAGCPDVDLNTIQAPDADINDAGANTILCVNCIRGSCQTEVSECNADCVCKTDLIDLFDCVAEAGAGGGAGTFQGCGLSSFGNNPTELAIAFALFSCAQKNCAIECGLPVDAGLDGAVDAEADAQADASGDAAGE